MILSKAKSTLEQSNADVSMNAKLC